MNPHELALTRPSTYEGLSGECGVVPLERASCGRTFGVVGLRPGGIGLGLSPGCHQGSPPPSLGGPALDLDIPVGGPSRTYRWAHRRDPQLPSASR